MKTPTVQPVEVRAGQVTLNGDLRIPSHARGLVIFAHGSGSSRFSTRNRQVAEFLDEQGFATLLLDLLTPQDATAERRTTRTACARAIWFRFTTLPARMLLRRMSPGCWMVRARARAHAYERRLSDLRKEARASGRL